MFKIIESALSTKFGKENAQALLEVIMNTPNATVATEKLLGIYEEPAIRTLVTNNSGKPLTLINYDIWNDRVDYKYWESKVVHIYVDEDVDTSLINAENYHEFVRDYGKSGVKGFRVDTQEMNERTSYCSIQDWQSYPETEILL